MLSIEDQEIYQGAYQDGPIYSLTNREQLEKSPLHIRYINYHKDRRIRYKYNETSQTQHIPQIIQSSRANIKLSNIPNKSESYG